MISFNGFLHRDRLVSILERWFFGGPGPLADALELKQNINLNAYIGCLILDALAHPLFTFMNGGPVLSFAAQTKGEIKDAITRNPRRVTPRTEALIARYKRHPEAYYRDTPFNARIHRRGDDASFYLGSTRVKRFRRMAEKASRDLVDFMFHQVKTTDEEQAVEGAARVDVPDVRVNAHPR